MDLLAEVVRTDGSKDPKRCPSLTQLAEFINDEFPMFDAKVQASWSSTDRQLAGTRFRKPGKGRRGNRIIVRATEAVKITGMMRRQDEFNPGDIVFQHDGSETYRRNSEVAAWIVKVSKELKP